MKRLLFYLSLLCLSAPAWSQQAGPFPITAATSPCALIQTSDRIATVGIQVVGTWVGTLQPQVTIQGQPAANTSVTPVGSTTPQSTITANGTFTSSAAGLSTFQICATAWTSGTANIYLNVSTGVSARGGSTGGGVSSFSAGNLSPLFTTGVATPTTTPALSFTLSNFAANTVFAGPASGAAAPPTARALVAADLPAGIVTSVSGTAGQIASTGGSTPVLSITNPFTFPGPASMGSNYISETRVVTAGGTTTAGLLVKTDPSTGNVNTAVVSDTGVFGVAITSQTAGQNVEIARIGLVSAVADNTITIGDIMVVGTTTAGRIKDSGQTTSLTVSNQLSIVGKALTSAVAGGSFTMQVYGPGFYGVALQAPGAIGGTTPGSGAFTSLSSTGVLSNSLSPAISQSALLLTGSPVTSGNTATNLPLLFLNQGAAASWSGIGGGTEFGINAPSGFIGNLIDLHVNGAASAYTITAAGVVTQANSLTIATGGLTVTAGGAAIAGLVTVTGGNISIATGNSYLWASSGGFSRAADGVITARNNANTGFTRLNFGGTTASFPAFGISGTTITAQLGDGTAGGIFAGATINAVTNFTANGTAGVSVGPITALTSITSTEGLVTALSGTSDERLKSGTNYSGGLAAILKIHPKRYHWNQKGTIQTGLSRNRQYVGFFAQDVQKAIPEAITGKEAPRPGAETADGSDYLTFDDRPIVAALVSAIHEQQEEIQLLKSRIQALE